MRTPEPTSDGDQDYVLFYRDKRTEVRSNNLLDAFLIAASVFKLNHSQAREITIQFSEYEGSPEFIPTPTYPPTTETKP